MAEGPNPDQIYTMAVAFHELFRSYVRAGFNENQALYLVGQQVRAASSGPSSDE
jgi:hypothetical protein